MLWVRTIRQTSRSGVHLHTDAACALTRPPRKPVPLARSLLTASRSFRPVVLPPPLQ